MSTDIVIIALTIMGLITCGSVWVAYTGQRLTHDVLALLNKGKESGHESEYINSDLYKPLLDTIRLHGYTEYIHYQVTAKDPSICAGGVTRRGLLSLMEDIGFPYRILHTPAGQLVINAMENRNLIGELDDDHQIVLTYQIMNDDHYQVQLTYQPTYADDTVVDTLGNSVNDMWLIEDEDSGLTLTDILLKDVAKFELDGELPAKYHSNFTSLLRLGSCITGASRGHSFQFESLDINSVKSSNPTIYARFTIKDAPSTLAFTGLAGKTIGEEFNQFMISQEHPLISHELATNHGTLRTINNEWYEDITLTLSPYQGEANEKEGYYLDIRISKRRPKVANSLAVA